VIPDPRSTFWKVPFEWDGDGRVPEDDGRDDVSWLPADGDGRLEGVVARALASSPDPADQALVGRQGARQAAVDILGAVSSWGVSRGPGWWRLLLRQGDVAGFVLPVIYDGRARDGRDEATIFHMGIVPEHRAQGLGRLLLRQATRTLAAHGVWRVYCDTAADNAPMIHLFESEGWTRLPPVQQSIRRPAP
jgi:ribosomal protein S18 acetylase RimI-like enzyme